MPWSVLKQHVLPRSTSLKFFHIMMIIIKLSCYAQNLYTIANMALSLQFNAWTQLHVCVTLSANMRNTWDMLISIIRPNMRSTCKILNSIIRVNVRKILLKWHWKIFQNFPFAEFWRKKWLLINKYEKKKNENIPSESEKSSSMC